MRCPVWLLFFIVGNCTLAASLQFRAFGKDKSSLTTSSLTKIAKPKVLTIWEPHLKKNLTFKALPLNPILDKVYGKSWHKADELFITCLDGYQPSIATSKFLKYSAYLAIEIPGKQFVIHNKKTNTSTAVGPFYLIWDNLKHKELRKEGATDFPYQLTGIELIRFDQRFPKIAPPRGRSPHVHRGFIGFRKHCLPCHTINGQGGRKSVELNYPINITEYFDSKWLLKWILDPRSVRYSTKMPSLGEPTPENKILARNIITYLEAMKHRKIKP